MNELSLTLNNSKIVTLVKNDDNTIYHFQSTTSHNGSDTSTMTSYPTSEGTPRTDHIYNNPNTFNFSAQISGTSDVTDEWGSGTKRPENALSLLTTWKMQAQSFTIYTPQKVYYNMFITSLAPASTTQNAYDLNIAIVFTELFISNFTYNVVGPFGDAVVEVNDGAEEDAGNKTAVEVVGSTMSGGAVLGAVIGGAIGGFAGVAIGGAVGILTGFFTGFFRWLCS